MLFLLEKRDPNSSQHSGNMSSWLEKSWSHYDPQIGTSTRSDGKDVTLGTSILNQRWNPLGQVGFSQKIYDFLTNLPSGEPILIGFPDYTYIITVGKYIYY